jgi:hypothetical protein
MYIECGAESLPAFSLFKALEVKIQNSLIYIKKKLSSM